FWRWPSGSGDSRVRERVSADKLGQMCFGHLVSQPTLGPLGQPEKAIGHEFQIEPWLAPDHRSALLVSELNGFVANRRRKPLIEETKPLGPRGQRPNPWCGSSEQISLNHVGSEARKNSGRRRCVFS